MILRFSVLMGDVRYIFVIKHYVWRADVLIFQNKWYPVGLSQFRYNPGEKRHLFEPIQRQLGVRPQKPQCVKGEPPSSPFARSGYSFFSNVLLAHLAADTWIPNHFIFYIPISRIRDRMYFLQPVLGTWPTCQQKRQAAQGLV